MEKVFKNPSQDNRKASTLAFSTKKHSPKQLKDETHKFIAKLRVEMLRAILN